MNRTQALEVALSALSTQQAEAEYYARQNLILEETRQFWRAKAEEAKAAYDVLTNILKKTEQQ